MLWTKIHCQNRRYPNHSIFYNEFYIYCQICFYANMVRTQTRTHILFCNKTREQMFFFLNNTTCRVATKLHWYTEQVICTLTSPAYHLRQYFLDSLIPAVRGLDLPGWEWSQYLGVLSSMWPGYWLPPTSPPTDLHLVGNRSKYYWLHTNSFNHPCVCCIELSNPRLPYCSL